MPIRISRRDSELVIRMPAPHALSQALIALSWVPFVLIALLVTWVAAQTLLSLGQQPVTGIAGGLFFVVFAIVILVFALFGFLGAVYGLIGSEVARVRDGELVLERVLFGAKQRQRYRDVRDLRVTKTNIEPRRWRTSPPRLLFESDGHTQAFGAGLNDEQAKQVLAAIEEALKG